MHWTNRLRKVKLVSLCYFKSYKKKKLHCTITSLTKAGDVQTGKFEVTSPTQLSLFFRVLWYTTTNTSMARLLFPCKAWYWGILTRCFLVMWHRSFYPDISYANIVLGRSLTLYTWMCKQMLRKGIQTGTILVWFLLILFRVPSCH